MREIKFRAWDKTEKRMCPVIALIYWDPEPGDPYQLGSCDIDDGKGAARRRYIEDIELMQYTGIKDCKWQEIYEGDIVRVEGTENRIVVHGPASFQLASHMTGSRILLEDRNTDLLEVIGNFYEHRHLIEGEPA